MISNLVGRRRYDSEDAEKIWLDLNWKPVWSDEYKTRMNKYLGIWPVVVWHV